MGSRMCHKSFTDPETHYRLIKSDTPAVDDGFRLGEPTGEVKCEEYGDVEENMDEIPPCEGLQPAVRPVRLVGRVPGY